MPINNALTPEGQNALGAAFGYYPQLRRNRTVQDPRLAAEIPLQVLRGRLAATLGLPSDVANLVRSPLPMEMFGDVDYAQQAQVPYGSQELLRTLPLPPQGAAQAAAANVGAVAPLSPMEALAAARAARQAAFATGRALGPAAAGMAENLLQRQGLMQNIIPVETAKVLNTRLNLPSNPEFLQAVQNTPKAQITDEGLLMSLSRSQKPEQAGEIAGRTGVFYLPEGSGSMTYYKHKPAAPNQTYGGSELFSGETLYKNPLFIKGATGGKAPQNAYDQLMGKGAYEKMRSDVLQAGAVRSIPSSRLSEAEKIDRIGETLKQYGGDPSMAENIYRTSPVGNQLAYAMQEHIVANAVRNAGYDSVLGYSKKKTGDPFLSEVFDVREKTYPSKVTESQVMNQFLQSRLNAE
jgi:hypothetical protein